MAPKGCTPQEADERSRRVEERRHASWREWLSAIGVAALLLTGAVALLLTGVGGCPLLLPLEFSDRYERLATLDCGKGRKVVMWVRHAADPAHDFLCYQVLEGDREVVARWGIYTIDELTDWIEHDITKLHYTLVTSRDGRLVGVVPQEFPYSVVCLHDFATGESWPHQETDETWRECAARRWRLRAKLLADHPALSPVAKVADSKYLARAWRLDLSHSRVTDSDLANLRGLTNIESVNLDHTNVTDAGLKHLYELPNLQGVTLRRTWVSAEGVAALRAARPGVDVRWQEP